MAKFKHNKKRNTALIYEALIRELTKTVISNEVPLQKQITDLIKETFSRRSCMYKELKLYHAISNTKDVSILTAEKIVNEVKRQHHYIDQRQLVVEQNRFGRKARKLFSQDIFSNFVPSYKNLASIYQIFNKNVSIKSKILLENQLVSKMSVSKDEQGMVPVDNLVFKSFVKRFNNEYKIALLKEQKELLNKFITSFHNNGVEFKIYLNEEIGRLKGGLKKALNTPELSEDVDMHKNTKKVLDLLESYKDEKPNKEMVEQVIKIQGLLSEVHSDGN